MIKRVFGGLVAAVMATVAFGTISAQPAAAVVKDPGPRCIWIWTADGDICQ